MVRRPSRPRHNRPLAEVAELADAHGSGPCTRKGVGVRVPSSAPKLFSCVLVIQPFAYFASAATSPGSSKLT